MTATPDPNEELRRLATNLAADRPDALEGIWGLIADDLFGLALYRTGAHADAEDVVQEVFVRLARSPDKLARARNPRGYLLRMAHNAAVDAITRRRPNETLDLATSVPSEETAADARLDATRATELLTALPGRQREAVFLRHFMGMSFREIGAVAGVSTFTAASRYRLAMRRLRQMIGVTP